MAFDYVVQQGDCFRYAVEMKLTGEMRFNKDAGVVPAKISASASHAYPERVLAVSGNMVQKSARVYEVAKLTVERGADKSVTTLRPVRKLAVRLRGPHQRQPRNKTMPPEPALRK